MFGSLLDTFDFVVSQQGFIAWLVMADRVLTGVLSLRERLTDALAIQGNEFAMLLKRYINISLITLYNN